MTDSFEFPDWNSFLQWKEKEESDTFTCYVKPNGSKENKDEGIMLIFLTLLIQKTLQMLKQQSSTRVAGMEKRRKTIYQGKALRPEGNMNHGNWENTAFQELLCERRKTERCMPSTFVLTLTTHPGYPKPDTYPFQTL